MKPTSYVWSRIRRIFHRAGCRWARRITRANREKGSLTVARALGLRRPCLRCLGEPDRD